MLFSILLLATFLYSGWLSTLLKEIKFPLAIFYIFFTVSSLTYFLPVIPLTADWFVHPGWVMILIAFLCLFWRLDHKRKASLIAVFLSSGTIVFSFHEIFHLHTDWTQALFRLLLFLVFALGGWISYRNWIDRTLYIWGGLLVTEGLILLAHREMFNPVVIGDQMFLDAFWMTMLLSVIFDLGMQRFPVRFRQDEGGL